MTPSVKKRAASLPAWDTSTNMKGNWGLSLLFNRGRKQKIIGCGRRGTNREDGARDQDGCTLQ